MKPIPANGSFRPALNLWDRLLLTKALTLEVHKSGSVNAGFVQVLVVLIPP